MIGSLLALLAAATAARADLTWDYSWSTTTALFPTQTGGITLAASPDGTGAGKQTVNVATIDTFGSIGAPPETLSKGDYQFDLSLTDKTSGDKGTLSFHGTLSGSFSSAMSSVANVFTDPNQSIVLGGNLYSVTMGPYTAPSPIGQPATGLFQATIDAEPAPTVPPPHIGTPEPATLLLAGLGLPAVWLVRRRRKLGL
jgi:hypothetical protein